MWNKILEKMYEEADAMELRARLSEVIQERQQNAQSPSPLPYSSTNSASVTNLKTKATREE